MPTYKNMHPVDLANGQARQVNIGTIYQGDSYANRIGAIVTENGFPVSLSGTCHGKLVQTIDGTTVLLENGVVDGNKAYCDLTPECYDSEGPVEIHIKWTNGTETAELLFASGYLKKTETDEVVDPSGRVTISVETLIHDIAEAEATIPEDYSILSNHVDTLTHIDLTESGYINGSGAEVDQSTYHRTGYIPIASDSLLVVDGFYVGSTSGSAYAYYFYAADKTPISGANGITTKTVVSVIPSNAAYVRFSSRISQGETPVAYVSNHVVETLVNLAPRMDDAEADVADLQNDASSADARITVLESVVGGGEGMTPAQLSAIAASGHAGHYFSPGDIIQIPWTDTSGDTAVEYQMPFVVVDIADAYDENNTKHEKAIWLQALRTTPYAIPFHAADRTEVDLSTETAAVSGWAYVGLSGTTYTALNLSSGDPIPTTYDTVYKTTYTGLALKAVQTGIARWKDSDARQWLNSTAAKDAGWWESQYNGATPPVAEYTNKPGFLGGFSADWQAVFKQVKRSNGAYLDEVTQTTDITYDKVFLPHWANVYATYTSGDNVNWPYWVSAVGTSSPTPNSSEARVLSPLGSASTVTWLMSSYRLASRMDQVRGINSMGAIDYYNSNSAYRMAPCVCMY